MRQRRWNPRTVAVIAGTMLALVAIEAWLML